MTPPPAPQPPQVPPWPQLPARAGVAEFGLPLWHARWRLLGLAVIGGSLGFVLCLFQPLHYSAQSSFVVQHTPRPSQAVAAMTASPLAGQFFPGVSMIDLYLAMLRSQTVSERIVERFDLQRAWQLPTMLQARQRLARRVALESARRDGVVWISVQDEHPQRAAAIANQYIEELRLLLRQFALEDARQRRGFYEAQHAKALEALAQAQRELQASGFDRAALRVEPRAAAEAYGRMQAEVTAAELRLAAARRVRAEDSPEVRSLLGELASLRTQLQKMEVPRDDTAGGGRGAFVERVRAYRYAEALADSMARVAEAARVEEAAEAVPVQVLDVARPPELPSGPRVPLWTLAGLAAALGLGAAVVLLRHRAALARTEPAYRERLELIRSVLPPRRGLAALLPRRGGAGAADGDRRTGNAVE
jgi:uncharacterized protein involved in exopolysaccharide biosynthesis